MAEAAVPDPGQVARALLEARRRRTPVEPPSETYPGMGLDDAYAVQRAAVEHLLGEGDEVVGWKLGLTSRAMQDLLGVDSPDFAPLLRSFLLGPGVVPAAADFIAPRVEAEVAVVLGRHLGGPDCTVEEVRAAATGYVAALEVVDTRIVDWRITLEDTVADLASVGAVVLSGTTVPPGGWDPRLTGMVFSVDGHVVATGAGAAALGDPLEAVAWLVRTLHRYGQSLQPGQVVITGALHAAVPVTAGQHVRAEFDRLGSVELRLS